MMQMQQEPIFTFNVSDRMLKTMYEEAKKKAEEEAAEKGLPIDQIEIPPVKLSNTCPRIQITFRPIEDVFSTSSTTNESKGEIEGIGSGTLQEYLQEVWLWNNNAETYEKISSAKFEFAVHKIANTNDTGKNKLTAVLFSRTLGVFTRGTMFFTWTDKHNTEESFVHKCQTLHSTFDYTMPENIAEFHARCKIAVSIPNRGKKLLIQHSNSNIPVQPLIQLNRYNTSRCSKYSTDSFEYSVSVFNTNGNVCEEGKISCDEYWLFKEKLQECYDEFLQLIVPVEKKINMSSSIKK